jgi:hypothetical protein
MKDSKSSTFGLALLYFPKVELSDSAGEAKQYKTRILKRFHSMGFFATIPM